MNKPILRPALLAAVYASCWLALTAASWADEIPEVNPLSGDPKAIASGRSWYRGVCSLCHGGRADGQGERGTGADLRKFQLGFRRYVETVKNGRQVQGRTQGMPAWNGVIDDKTIYEIGAYLETLAMEGANWKEGVVHK
jgi:mono/diheme cytochrome c family protein